MNDIRFRLDLVNVYDKYGLSSELNYVLHALLFAFIHIADLSEI